jgi:hypothetical protein
LRRAGQQDHGSGGQDEKQETYDSHWLLLNAFAQLLHCRILAAPGKDKYYRVQVGPYAGAQSATNARHDLEANGFKSIVKRRSPPVADQCERFQPLPTTGHLPGIVSGYAVIRFLTATFGHADIQITCSIRKKTLSYRIRSRSQKYVLTSRIKYQ